MVAGAAAGVEWHCEAGLVGQAKRPREGQERTCRRLAKADELAKLGVILEGMDDVRLPVGGAVGRIGRVEGRFLVGIVGEVLLQLVQDGLRRVGRDRMGQEPYRELVDDQRPDLILGVAADRRAAAHDEFRFVQHLAPASSIVISRARKVADRETDQESATMTRLNFVRRPSTCTLYPMLSVFDA